MDLKVVLLLFFSHSHTKYSYKSCSHFVRFFCWSLLLALVSYILSFLPFTYIPLPISPTIYTYKPCFL